MERDGSLVTQVENHGVIVAVKLQICLRIREVEIQIAIVFSQLRGTVTWSVLQNPKVPPVQGRQ